jgi:hypothetical protein
MEAVDFYETPITPYETTKDHNAEDRNLNFNPAFIFYKYFDYWILIEVQGS